MNLPDPTARSRALQLREAMPLDLLLGQQCARCGNWAKHPACYVGLCETASASTWGSQTCNGFKVGYGR